MGHDRRRGALRGEAGQTMVEFALVVALLLAILFGIVEFGRLWFYSNHLNNSVRAAARYGAVLGNNSSVGTNESRIVDYAYEEITSYINAVPGSDTPGGVIFEVQFL